MSQSSNTSDRRGIDAALALAKAAPSPRHDVFDLVRSALECVKSSGVEVDLEAHFPILKGLHGSDERYVLGIVLEPDSVDAHGDRISQEEIEKAAHAYMERFGRKGLMHRKAIDDRVRLLETYLAPVDFEIGGAQVKKGTWLMAWRIMDDYLWKSVRDETLTGFSIGGQGRRVPTGEESRA